MDECSDRRLRRRQELERHGEELLAGLGGHALRLSTNDQDTVFVWDGDVEVASCPHCSRPAVVTRSIGQFLADGPTTLQLALQLARPAPIRDRQYEPLPGLMTGPSCAAKEPRGRDIAARVIVMHQLAVDGTQARCRADDCLWSVDLRGLDMTPEWLHAQHVASEIASALAQ